MKDEIKELCDLDKIINYMEGTIVESWCTDVVKTKDGKNCFFGHLFDYGGGDKSGGAIMGIFEDVIATTYMIYPVNDGENPKYQQPTAKERVIAYLKDLRDGNAKTTHQLMEEDYQEYCRNKAKHPPILNF